MPKRLTIVALSCFAVAASGCGGNSEADKNAGATTPAVVSTAQPVTLHVEGMTRRLKLF
jgi:hypothetical protein